MRQIATFSNKKEVEKFLDRFKLNFPGIEPLISEENDRRIEINVPEEMTKNIQALVINCGGRNSFE